jgi:adenosylhomocysteine nucleosidase
MVERRRLGSLEYAVGHTGDVEVYLIKTGMGPAAAAAAAQSILSGVALDAMVSTGYAGALGPAGIGDVIVGTDVRDWTREHAQAIFLADPALLAMAREAAGEAKLAWLEGPVATAARVLCRADEKRALAETSGAIAVDMESVEIARAAASRNVPFLLVRAVSDRAGDDLPMDFNLWLTPGGRVRALARLVRRPSILGALFRMKRQVEQGSQNLACFFQVWWRLMGQEHASARMHGPSVMGVRA